MIKSFRKTALGVALGATALVGIAPAAQARDGYGHGRSNAGAAVVAGIAGLAIGAAIGGGHNNRGGYNGYNGYNRYSYNYSYDNGRGHSSRGYSNGGYYRPSGGHQGGGGNRGSYRGH